MKPLDSNSLHDVTRGPVSPEELVEAAELWKVIRHLTSCDDAGVYGMDIQNSFGTYTARYYAHESTSSYYERGHGTDPVAALLALHDCTGEGCNDPKHNEKLDAVWRVLER